MSGGEKMTPAQARIGMDLARTASERCQTVMMDSVALCDHPIQQWTIGLHIAAMALGAIGGAISKQSPGLTYEECQTAALDLLKGMMDGSLRSLADANHDEKGATP